jgi:hypothetical protein
MATVQFQDANKTKINFSGNPTPEDIEEAYSKVTASQQAQETPVGGSSQSDTSQDKPETFSELSQSQDTTRSASGPLETSVGAIASGLMKGSEGILQTMQGATNIAGNAINAVAPGPGPSQVFTKLANQIEKDRRQFLGNQESLHGKVLENIAQLPGIVAMLGTPEGAGLLGARGGLEAFAGQAALQAQPQTQGKDIKTQVGNMLWAGTKGAAFGAVIGKAIKMGPVAGPALAGAYTAVSTALNDGDPNDILAGAITGAGLTTLSNPKNLATILTATKESLPNLVSGAKNTLEQLKTKGPITVAADIVSTRANNYYEKIKEMNEAPDKIADIDQKISKAESEQQESMRIIAEDAKEQERIKQEKINQNKVDTAGALTDLEQRRNLMERRVSALLSQKQLELGNNLELLQGQMSSGVRNVVFGLKKGGGLNRLFSNISAAYDKATEGMGEIFSATSRKPLTRFDLIDCATAAQAEIADANGNLPNGGAVADELNKTISLLKERPLMSKSDIEDKIAGLKKLGASNETIQQYRMKNTKIDQGEPVPYATAKVLFDRVKNSDPYGSHEADIVRQSFGRLIEKKLQENGQDTSIFKKIQSDMSDAISAKKSLARIFSLKDGIYSTSQTGYKFLEDVATGKGEDGSSNSAMPKLIDVLEKGITIGGVKAEGVGDITSNLKKMGENLSSVEKQYKEIGSKEKRIIANVGKSFVDRMNRAKAEGKLSKERIDLEHKRVMEVLNESKKQLDDNINKQLEVFKGSKEKQQEILQRKKDIAACIGAMGLTVSAYCYRIGAIARAGSRIFARNATGFGKRP